MRTERLVALVSSILFPTVSVGVASTFVIAKDGFGRGVVPPHTQWGGNAEIFVKAFQGFWTVVAGLAAVAIVTSALRGLDRRGQKLE